MTATRQIPSGDPRAGGPDGVRSTSGTTRRSGQRSSSIASKFGMTTGDVTEVGATGLRSTAAHGRGRRRRSSTAAAGARARELVSCVPGERDPQGRFELFRAKQTASPATGRSDSSSCDTATAVPLPDSWTPRKVIMRPLRCSAKPRHGSNGRPGLRWPWRIDESKPRCSWSLSTRAARGRSCSTTSRTISTQSSCSLSVRMKRSAQPLPSGDRPRTTGSSFDAEEAQLALEVVAHVLACRGRGAAQAPWRRPPL